MCHKEYLYFHLLVVRYAGQAAVVLVPAESVLHACVDDAAHWDVDIV